MKAVEESGYKKNFISEQLGIANQNFSKKVYQKNLSLDAANEILNVIGLEAVISIEKILQNE